MNTKKPSYRLVHAVLQVRLGTENFIHSRGSQRFGDLCEEQKIVEQEAVQLLVTFGFVEFPAVQELPRPQTVGDGVEHQLLEHGHDTR